MTDLNSAMFFFFKQKTAYEMRISDWSSDVCSSDLRDEHHQHAVADPARGAEIERPGEEHGKGRPKARTEQGAEDRNAPQQRDHAPQDQWHRDHVDALVGCVAMVARIVREPAVDAALAGGGAHTEIPASRSSASAYLARVRSITAAGSLGPGAVLSQSSVSR